MQEADGSVSLFDSETQERAYVIPTPLMYDANETVSYDVSYTLTGSGNAYELTVTADEAWINAEDRAMPVTINQDFVEDTFIYDTFIRSTYPDATHGGASALWLSRTPSSVGITEVLIKGNIPELPAGCAVTNAYMQAWYYYNDNVTAGTFNIGVYPVYSYWGEYSITWESSRSLSVSDSWIYVAFTSATNNATLNSPKAITVPLTSLARSWISGSVLNNGVMLKYESGTNLSVTLRSSESSTLYSPSFYVEYEVQRFPDGVYEMTNAALPGNAYTGSYAANAPVTLKYNSGAVTKKELFKIIYLGMDEGEDYYVIRSMANNALGLSAPTTGGGVTMEPLPASPTLANVSESQRWTISYTEGRHVIRNGGNGGGAYLSVANSLAEEQLQATATATASSTWLMTSHVGYDVGIEFIESKDFLKVNETYDFHAVACSWELNVNGPVTYSVREVGGGSTDKATINTQTGVLTARKFGYVEVGATCVGTNNTSWIRVGIYQYGPVTVEFVYDGGYANRFSDENTDNGETEIVDRISYQARLLEEKYLKEMGLRINWTGVEKYNSYADECRSDCERLEEQCSNGYSEEDDINKIISVAYAHHRNLYNNLYDLYFNKGPSNGNQFKIAYLGHDYCYLDSNRAHKNDHPFFGLRHGNVAVIADIQNAGEHEEQTLIHEFGHMLGAVDHYGQLADGFCSTADIQETYGPEYSFSEDCIYGENKERLSEYIICPGCEKLMKVTNGWDTDG